MIKPGEIQRKANAAGVRDQQIEKDYILSWILQGIAQHTNLSGAITFKGGTVLKKAYFADYRFSEDLDFTLLDNRITKAQIFNWFTEVFDIVKEEANIPLNIISNDEYEDENINFFISYSGPLGGGKTGKKVKVDISRSEKMVMDAVDQNILLAYTDQEEHQLSCYTLEEVLVEKMRSVMQRMQARDFYDLWYLLEVYRINAAFYMQEFEIKCKSKGLNPADFPEKLEQRLPQYKGRWQKTLGDQIQNLPDFNKIEREVMRNLKNLDFRK